MAKLLDRLNNKACDDEIVYFLPCWDPFLIKFKGETEKRNMVVGVRYRERWREIYTRASRCHKGLPSHSPHS